MRIDQRGGRAEHVRSARVNQTSTCSAMARGIIELDSEVSDGAFNLGVAKQKLHAAFVRRREWVPKRLGSSPILASTRRPGVRTAWGSEGRPSYTLGASSGTAVTFLMPPTMAPPPRLTGLPAGAEKHKRARKGHLALRAALPLTTPPKARKSALLNLV
jgi:hypothetical protein